MAADKNKSKTHARKQKRKHLKRERIVSIAMEFLGEHDLDELTLQQIADELGLTKNALYHYFNSKQAIIVAVATKLYEILVDKFESCRKKGEPGMRTVKKMGGAFWEMAREYPYFHDVFLAIELTQPLQGTKNPDKAPVLHDGMGMKKLMGSQQRFVTMWQQSVQEGINDGSIRHDLPASMIALLLGMMTRGVIAELDHAGFVLEQLGVEPEEMFSIALDILERGLHPE